MEKASNIGKIGKTDLLLLEQKITEEQTRYRHAMKNDIQKYIMDMDELKTETKVLSTKVQSMKEDIQTIKDWQKEINVNLEKFRESIFTAIKDMNANIEKNYTKKYEHENNQDRIKSLEAIFSRINWMVITALVAALLSLIIK